MDEKKVEMSAGRPYEKRKYWDTFIPRRTEYSLQKKYLLPELSLNSIVTDNKIAAGDVLLSKGYT